MFFNPKMLFFRKPIPQSFWELSKTEGNEVPVFDSTTETPLSAKLSEPQRGIDRSEEKKEFRAFRRKERSEEDTAAAAANAVNGRGNWGRWGWRNEKGKRSMDDIFASLVSLIQKTSQEGKS